MDKDSSICSYIYIKAERSRIETTFPNILNYKFSFIDGFSSLHSPTTKFSLERTRINLYA